MEWLELKPLGIEGMVAAVINRRIGTHLKFRQTVEGGEFIGNRFRKASDGVYEAYEREYFIRRDIVELYNRKGVDAAEHVEAMTKLNAAMEALR